jgi:hypothetical protein
LTHTCLTARLALLLLASGCAQAPKSDWQRSDVSVEATLQVELDCRQRSIESIPPGANQAEAQFVHGQRQEYFERCMRGSGFTRRP